MSSINFDPITAAETEMGTRQREEPTAPPELETPKIYTFDPTTNVSKDTAFAIRPMAEKTVLTAAVRDVQVGRSNVVLAVQLSDLPPHDEPIVRLRYEHIEGWHPVEVVTKIIDDAVMARYTTVHTVEFAAPLVIDMVGVQARHAYALYAELADEFERCKIKATHGAFVYINDIAHPATFPRRMRDAARVYRSLTSNHRWIDEHSGSLLSSECVVKLIDELLHDRILLEQQAVKDAATIAELREHLTPPSTVGVIETDHLSPEEDAALVEELRRMGLEMDRMNGLDLSTAAEIPRPDESGVENLDEHKGHSRLIHTEAQLAEALKVVERMTQDKVRMEELLTGLRQKVQTLEDAQRIGVECSGG